MTRNGEETQVKRMNLSVHVMLQHNGFKSITGAHRGVNRIAFHARRPFGRAGAADASDCAIALPMPRSPPVTMAVFPVSVKGASGADQFARMPHAW
jgi:hypothetical protein